MTSKTILVCWLNQFIISHRIQFKNILRRRSELAFVVNQIKTLTPLFGENEINNEFIDQRMFWIFNDISSWNDNRVKCKQCGKSLIHNFGDFYYGYRVYCSKKCANSSEDSCAKSKATRFKKNGGKYFSDETNQKRKNTFIERYGVDNNMKSEEGKKSHRDAIEKKYGKGITNVFQAESCKNKISMTKEQRYGDKNFNNPQKGKQTRSIHAKDPDFQADINRRIQQTSTDRYGVPHPMKCDEVAQRSQANAQKTLSDRYGVHTYMKTPQFQQECIDTWIQNYGVDHPMKCPEVRIRQQQSTASYICDDILFDSSWEVSFYLYHKILGHDVKYNDELTFQYECNSKQHAYIPDFIVDRKVYEIKGNQFFNEDGKMICPYRNEGMSDETYQELCDISEAKHQCMIRNNVIICKKDEMTPIIAFLKDYLGKNYLDRFRKENYMTVENESSQK